MAALPPPTSTASRRQKALDLLRFPLAIVVLINHVWAVEGLQLNGEAIDWRQFPVFREVLYLIDGFLRSQSVPVYFFISGFVFFFGVEWCRATFFRKLENRVKTLLIPYLVWNAFAVVLLLAGQLSFFFGTRAPGSDFHFSFPALVSCFWNYTNGFFPQLQQAATDGGWLQPAYPLNVPLWFLRDLMIVVVCAPLLYPLLKRLGAWAVMGLGVLWLVAGYSDAGRLYQLSTAFFFFAWGACMSIRKKDMLVEFGRYFKLSMWAYPLLGALCVVALHCWPEAAFTLKRLNIVVGLFFAYNAATWWLEHGRGRPWELLTASSFFVYVAHYPLCNRLRRLLLVVVQPQSDFALLAVYTLTVVLTIGLLLMAFYLLKRYAPKVLKVVAGRA